jgi:hypothetical protein
MLCNVLLQTHTGYIRGNRIFLTLEGAQVGSMLGTFREIVVVCTLGGGVPRGVGSTLGDSVSS